MIFYIGFMTFNLNFNYDVRVAKLIMKACDNAQVFKLF